MAVPSPATTNRTLNSHNAEHFAAAMRAAGEAEAKPSTPTRGGGTAGLERHVTFSGDAGGGVVASGSDSDSAARRYVGDASDSGSTESESDEFYADPRDGVLATALSFVRGRSAEPGDASEQ